MCPGRVWLGRPCQCNRFVLWHRVAIAEKIANLQVSITDTRRAIADSERISAERHERIQQAQAALATALETMETRTRDVSSLFSFGEPCLPALFQHVVLRCC